MRSKKWRKLTRRRKIKRILDFVQDILFPRRCPFCDGVTRFGRKHICPECESKLLYVGDSCCRKCGRPLTDDTAEYCRDCMKNVHAFDRGVSLMVYNDISRGAIFRFKYRNRQEYADSFADETVRKLGSEIAGFRADAIIPVPLHRDKLKKRGFNQAELLAKGIGERMKICVRTDVISRIRATIPQKSLSRAMRQKNLKKSFKIEGNVVKLNTVIIIDDIYTTGSTIDEMAAVLKNAGVRKVFFVTLATGSAI